MGKTKDAKNLKEYNITIYQKGFLASSIYKGNTINEYFQYRQIYNIIHHPNIGIEIVAYNGFRKVFYHDLDGESQFLFDSIIGKMNEWLGLNLN
jgi:hypothetical protein